MGLHLPSPPSDILRPCLRSPHHLVSVIPTQHPTHAYHTWISHSGEGRAGLDHILTAAEHIAPTCTSGIDHEIAREYLSSDHCLIYATFALACPNTAPPPPPTTLYHYRKVAQIPLVNTYPTKYNNFTPPWFAPQTLGILPDDVAANAKMHEALSLAQDNPKVIHHLQQAAKYLTDLDNHTTTLYLAHHKSTTPSSPTEDLISRTPRARRLINHATASWQKGIEQMMKTAKLVTILTPKPKQHTPSKRASKRAKRTTRDKDRVTYRDTFNMINSTLATHSILLNTLKQSKPTIFAINRPHIALLNNLMHDVAHKHQSLCHDLCRLDRQLQEQHDTRVVQTAEYSRHHTTPDAGKHAPFPTHSTESHLINTCHVTAALAATINKPYVADAIHTLYTAWLPILPPDPVFMPTDTPTDVCRKYSLLHTVHTSAKRMLRRTQQRLLRTIARQKTNSINHDININQLHNACRNARPKRLSAPTLCISTTTPPMPGGEPIKTQAMTIPQQIQATKDTYGRQMAPPPGDSLFYGTLVHDAAGPAGVTMHPHRHFTEAHLPAYHPFHSMFDMHTKQRVIAAHRNLRHLFQPTPSHRTLRWPWRLKSPTTTHDKVPQLLPHIRSIPGSARHDGFTLNVLARLPPLWTHLAQRLIQHCLVHRILPQVTKNHTKVPIPKPDDPFTHRPITLNHDWEAFLTG